jgi:pantoate--beta-alanine ligase
MATTVVIASIFVNRLQFRPGEDFDKYPRTFEADCQRMVEAGVDHLFAPAEVELYPQAAVVLHRAAGRARQHPRGRIPPRPFSRRRHRGHEALLRSSSPRSALFGKKDYQQFMVLSATWCASSTCRSRSFPARRCGPPDGLALSSRNGYLTASRTRRGAAPVPGDLREIAAEIQPAAPATSPTSKPGQ